MKEEGYFNATQAPGLFQMQLKYLCVKIDHNQAIPQMKTCICSIHWQAVRVCSPLGHTFGCFKRLAHYQGWAPPHLPNTHLLQ